MKFHYKVTIIEREKSLWENFWLEKMKNQPLLDYKKEESFLNRTQQLEGHTWNQEKIYEWFKVEHQGIELTTLQNENLNKINNPKTLFIFTGQQPQVLAGPMYTFYKILTAVEQAKEWEKNFGKLIVPVFWIAGDDTDALECGHLETIENQKHYNLFTSFAQKKSLSSTYIQKEMENIFPFLKQCWSSEIVDFLRKMNVKDKTLSQWFKELLQFFLGYTGILFVDGSSKLFRNLAKNKMEQMIKKQDQMSKLLQESSQELFQKYGKTQVKLKDQIHAFELKNNQRFRVNSSKFDINKIYTHDVLSRSILISSVFPVISHVLGPGEIGYFLQLQRVFDIWEGGSPLIIPRMSAFVFPGSLEDKVKKDNFNFENLLYQKPSQIKKEWIYLHWNKWKEKHNFKISFFEKIKCELEDQRKQGFLPKDLYEIPTEKLLKKIKNQEKYWIEDLQKVFFNSHQKQYQDFLIDFEWFCSGVSQERSLNIFSLVNQLGFHSMRCFFNTLDPLNSKQQIIFWESSDES